MPNTFHIAPAGLYHAIDAASPPYRSSQIEQAREKVCQKVCLKEEAVYIAFTHPNSIESQINDVFLFRRNQLKANL